MKRKMKVAVLLALFVSSKATLLPKKCCAPSRNVLAIRGGATLDKDIVAKSASVVGLVYGGLGALCPAKLADAYNLDLPLSPVLEFIIERSATTVYTANLMWWAIAQNGASLNMAVTILLVPWILLSLHSILNEKPKELDFPVSVEYLQLAINSFVAHATFTDAAYADTAIKGLAIWCLFNSVLLFFKPVLFGKLYGTGERDEFVYFVMRNHGNDLAIIGVLVGALSLGMDPITANGYAWLQNLLGLATMMFITKDVEKQNIDKAPCYAWLVFMSLVAYVLLS